MANPFKTLQGILAEDPVQVGTVISVNGDGTSQVLLVGSQPGEEVTVVGDSFSPGQPVFMQSRRILSASPTLSFDLIEV